MVSNKILSSERIQLRMRERGVSLINQHLAKTRVFNLDDGNNKSLDDFEENDR